MLSIRPFPRYLGVSHVNAPVPVEHFTTQRWRLWSFPSRQRHLMSCRPDDPTTSIVLCGALWKAGRKSRSLQGVNGCDAHLRPEQSICWAENTVVSFLGMVASLMMLSPVDTCAAVETPEFTASTALRKILPYVLPNQSLEGKCFNDVCQSQQSLVTSSRNCQLCVAMTLCSSLP